MQNFEKPAENLRTILNVADPNSPHFNTFFEVRGAYIWLRLGEETA